MPKQPVSVTLDEANILWLKGRAASNKRRSLSEALDDVVTAARTGGPGGVAARSVVGTVDIAIDDPGLDYADAAIAPLVAASIDRRLGAKGTSPSRRQVKPRG